MLFVSAALVLLGVAIALMGEKLFRILLPLLGLVAGFLVGWSGVEAIFGINALSIPVALLTGLFVGALTAVLSYLYFSIALVVLTSILFAYGTMYLGLALGLSNSGFLMLLLAIAGSVIGLVIALNLAYEHRVVVLVTAFYGVAMVLAGVLLVAGSITLDGLHDNGIIRSVVDTVDNQFIWLFAWIGGSLLAANLQGLASRYTTVDDTFAYVAPANGKKKVKA